MIKNVYGLLIYSLILFSFFSCTLPPSYSPENIDNILKKICKDEFNLDVRVWKKGETIWVYAPFKRLMDIDGNWDKKVSDDIRKISQALTRVILNMDRPLRFYSFVISDIEDAGVDIYRIGFIPDRIKFEMGLISFKEIQQRELYITINNPKALGDINGGHIQKYDIPIGEFIAALVRQRMDRYFTSSEEFLNNYLINSFYSEYAEGILDVTFDIEIKKDKKKNDFVLRKIESIVKELIETYSSFQNINKVIINDILNEKNQEIIFKPYRDKTDSIKYSEDKIENNISKKYKSAYYITLGNTYFKGKNFNDAILAYNKSVNINPYNSVGFAGLGNCFYFLNKHNEALINFRKALEIIPDNFEVNYRTGYIYMLLEKYNDALNFFNMAAKLSPNNFDVYRHMASIHLKFKEYEKSIANYKKAIDLNPNLPNVYYDLGIIYYDLKRYPESNANYKKAIDLNPNFFEAYYNLGINYILHEEYDEALKVYLKAVDIKPGSIITLERLGLIYVSLNRYENAISCFMKILDIEADNANAFLNIGLVYLRLKDYDKGKDNFLKAKEIFTNKKMYNEIKKMDMYLRQIP